MSKKTKGKAKAKRTSGSAGPYGGRNASRQWRGRYWLVLIDDTPLRDDAATQCRRRFQRLKTLRENWYRFERHDQPAFQRWRASMFGPQLTELRTMTDRIAEFERLFEEVESEAFFANCSHKSAYQRIMRERSMAPKNMTQSQPDDDEADAFEEDAEIQEELNELATEEMFWVFLEELHVNPEELPDSVYKAWFEQFKSTVNPRGSSASSPPPGADVAREPLPDAASLSLSARCKDLYRRLVRRLHPDVRGDAGNETMHLWHEVQDAHATGDLERMEMLQALTDIHENTIGRTTPLSHLREALREIERAVRALEKSLRGARKSLEWDFARTGPAPNLHAHFDRQIGAALIQAQEAVARYEATVAQWQQPSRKKKKAKPRTDRPEAVRVPVATQAWMDF
jgi:hypothetical protein